MINIVVSAFILIYNLLFFVIGEGDHDAAVWIAYGAIHLAYVCVIATPLLVKRDKNQAANIAPLLNVSLINFILQVVVGTIIILIAPDDHVATLVIEIILLVIFLAAFLSVFLANVDTTKAADRQQAEVLFIREQATRVKLLIGRCMGGKLDKRLERLYDTLFSFPTRSSNNVKSLENSLALKIQALEKAVLEERVEDAELLIDEALLLLENIRSIIKNNQ